MSISNTSEQARLFREEEHPYGEGMRPIESEVLADLRDLSILDLGAGDGRLAIELAGNDRGNRVVAVELLDDAIAAMRRHASESGVERGQLEIIQADLADAVALDRQLAEQHFDVITIANVLHFLSDEEARAVLKLAAQHLSENGELMVRGPQPHGPLYERLKPRSGFTQDELSAALLQAGLYMASYREFEWQPKKSLPEPQPAFIAVASRNPIAAANQVRFDQAF